jgi:hypothetical protein
MITYNEFLPALLGSNALPKYSGYNPNVNPTIANEFSTVLFRFDHSILDNEVDRLNNDGTDIADPNGASVDLTAAFFNPILIDPTGAVDPLTGQVSTDIDPILKVIASGVAQETDLLAVRDIRNFLFGNGDEGGEDLIARDIQRARDNGLPDYNTMRADNGLPRVTSFAQITSNVQVQQKLQQFYASVNTSTPSWVPWPRTICPARTWGRCSKGDWSISSRASATATASSTSTNSGAPMSCVFSIRPTRWPR